jgi:tetratricopeptide (TPR) repeat protein
LGYVCAINLNQPAEAIEYFKKSVSLDPLIEDGYLNLSNTYALLNKYDEALNAYEKQIIFTPSSTSAYINSGRIYQMLGKKPLARKMYQKALNIEPRLAIAKKLLEEL